MDSRQVLLEIRGRPVTFVPGKKVISVAPGEWTSPYEGKGYEPLGYRDFEIGDDPRRINLPATARRGIPTVVERVALRDFKVMVIIDRSSSMLVRQKLAIQLGAAAVLLYSAWQSETTFGLAVKTDEKLHSFGMGIGSKHFYFLYQKLWEVLSPGGNGALKGTRNIHLSRCLPPNAMLIYCSDFLDATGALVNLTALTMVVHRYDFIPVIIQDEFEFAFPLISHGTFIAFSNPETMEQEEVWISPDNALRINAAHESRFDDLLSVFGTPGVSCLHLGTSDVKKMGRQIDGFFRTRSGRAG